ncbi:MAG TPA: hypothetical protein V6D06_19795 [Trichocoleus sp.]
MKESLWLTTGLVTAVLWGCPKTAQANNIALAFTLPPVGGPQAAPADPEPQESSSPPELLPVPAQEPPVQELAVALPPPPPPISERSMAATPVEKSFSEPASKAALEPVLEPTPESGPELALEQASALPPSVSLPLNSAASGLPSSKSTALEMASGASTSARPPALPTPETLAPETLVPDLFAGGSESLVARAVGSAEGTRTALGQRTAAYYGHQDPGNGAWNLGSFSYQHGATTPEEADAKQLKRLQAQVQVLKTQAEAKGLELTLAEILNGIDLANQAPVAALDRGYVDWLYQAHSLGMTGEDAILYARTRAFLDPDTGRWNAPGLGNTVAAISQDQERRMKAIALAMDVDKTIVKRLDQPLKTTKSQAPDQVSPSVPQQALESPAAEAEAVDFVLSLDLP